MFLLPVHMGVPNPLGTYHITTYEQLLVDVNFVSVDIKKVDCVLSLSLSLSPVFSLSIYLSLFLSLLTSLRLLSVLQKWISKTKKFQIVLKMFEKLFLVI